MAKESANDLEKMRHTAAHILAAASEQLKPETKLGVGPATEDGFFHDIDVAENWTEKDIPLLQKEMNKIKGMDLPLTHRQVSKDEAKEIFAHDPYKLELIEEIKGDTVGISEMGEGFFVTLCEGGHVASTGKIGEFKLTRLAGVYWKGDESRAQLQRIYGILFPNRKELKEYEQLQAEALKRDHRKLGKELDLFTFSPLVGSGLPLFTPRGAVIRQELVNFLQELQKPMGYQPVVIPHITKADLYKKSGHWEKFQDDLFHVKGKSGNAFVMKPMNCPHHTQIYASQKRSYRDMPIRYSEVTAVYRDEQAGELQGLSRVRAITQDDAHVFCRLDQVQDEVGLVLKMISDFYAAFSFKLRVRLSLHDSGQMEKYLGEESLWEKAEGMLEEALRKQEINDFTKQPGEAAFYGPKIDFLAQDSLKREWQVATVQLDFNMPERFELSYTDETGRETRPVMIHRAITGALERFMAILIEHYAGALPMWLSPTQVAVLPISDDQGDLARQVVDKLIAAGIRGEVDGRGESIGKKIREAEMMKVPVMLIIGKKEAAAGTVSVRSREKGDKGTQKIAEAIQELKERIVNRKELSTQK